MTRTKTVEDWLRLAWAKREGCPPPEIFLPQEWSDLEDEARDRATRHLETCPACAAERDLAQAFEATQIPNPRAEAETVALLERIASESPPPGEVGKARMLRFPSLTRFMPQRVLALAAAALFVVAVAAVVRDRIGPGLPDVPTDDVVRSGRLVPVAPAGEVETTPTTFEWLAMAETAAYRVTLTAVDETVLWTGETSEPPLEVPTEVQTMLRARVVYFWQVEAIDARGVRLGWSQPTEFRLLHEAQRARETPR